MRTDLIRESLARIDLLREGHHIQTLREAYRQPQRHYHTLEHISDILENLEKIAYFHSLSPDDIDHLHIITWYHDLVYDPTNAAGENELQSANIYKSLPSHSMDIWYAIEGTRQHLMPETFVAACFFDLDLAGLGSDMSTYARNGENVRKEYGHVSDADWKLGRSKFLNDFLNRPSIYHTAWGAELERTARANMSYELFELENS